MASCIVGAVPWGTIVMKYRIVATFEHRMINPVVDPLPPANHRVSIAVL